MTFMSRIRAFIQRHRIALVVALLVGTICVAPAVTFRISMGTNFHGVDYLPLDDEEFYLARMQEVADGHWLVGSFPYAEYKNALPILPPTIEVIHVGISKILHSSLSATLIFVKFLFPALLFFLVYSFLLKLLGDETTLGKTLTAIAGGLWVVLAPDILAIGHVLQVAQGAVGSGGQPMWTRPVNPISGGILLFAFLNLTWSVVVRRDRRTIIPAGIMLALMFASYFFTWGSALSVLGVLGLTYLIQKNWPICKDLGLIVATGLLISLPYWILVTIARGNPLFPESAGRFGLIASHEPLLNVYLLAGLAIFIVIIAWSLRGTTKQSFKESFSDWIRFCGAMLFGGLLALNQQVLTGKTVWPFHFVQYTIPFVLITLTVLLYRVIRPRIRILWILGLAALLIVPVAFSIQSEAIGYRDIVQKYRDMQRLGLLFNWLNASTTRDSVVFVKGNVASLERLIPAYTHNNTYFTEIGYAMAPYDRFVHDYMSYLRLNGVRSEDILPYLESHHAEAVNYLHTELIVNLPQRGHFENIEDLPLTKTLLQFTRMYRDFLSRPFKDELNKYQLNYIVSDGEIDAAMLKELGNPPKVFSVEGLNVYQMN